MLENRVEKQFTIAVVDDNPAILQLVAKVLRIQGYRVLEAGCGAEALDAAKWHERPVDLLADRYRHAGNGWSFTIASGARAVA